MPLGEPMPIGGDPYAMPDGAEDAAMRSAIADLLLRSQRLESKLDRLLSPPEAPIISLEEAMKVVGAGSLAAFRRFQHRFGVYCYSRGKYRRLDLTTAISRRIIEESAMRKRADEQEEEAKAARQVRPEPVNPHE